MTIKQDSIDMGFGLRILSCPKLLERVAVQFGQESCDGFQLSACHLQPLSAKMLPALLKMSPALLRILLVEDDELFRLGLKMRLQQEVGMEIVAEAEDGETAVEMVSHQPIDIVLLDIALPGIGGIEACRQIKQRYPELPVLVLTSRFQKSFIARLIEVGAHGYCLKGIAAETLVLAIRSVAAGASWWDHTATTEIRAALKSNATEACVQDTVEGKACLLTRREQEILALLATGKTNQEIAQQLYIAPGTVRVHVHAILHKLEVRDRTQAVVVAIQKQLIPTDLLTQES